MKFTVATKPFSDGLNLAIINSNITQYYQKSCVTQITAKDTVLRVNVEADGLRSEVILRGKADVPGTEASVMVDSVLLKQLVGTFEDAVTTVEFTQGGLILHSGKSQFTLPQMLDATELSLAAPVMPVEGQTVTKAAIKHDDWRFIKDSQLYAIAMAFIHPVYTYVWVGNNGQVLVGDVDNGVFTQSFKGNLNTTCLLKDTIINLFDSLPEGAELLHFDNNYIISVVTDGFTLRSQFVPVYEDDEDVGSYNSEMISGLMAFPDDECVKVSSAALNKFLSQADLFSRDVEKTIKLDISNNQLTLKDDYVDCAVKVEGSSEVAFHQVFKTKLLKAALNHFTQDVLKLAPMYQEDQVVGIIIQSEDLTTVIAGVDE